MHVGCFIFGGGGGGKQACRWGGGSLQKGPFIATKWCEFGYAYSVGLGLGFIAYTYSLSRLTAYMVKIPTGYFSPSCGGGGGGGEWKTGP